MRPNSQSKDNISSWSGWVTDQRDGSFITTGIKCSLVVLNVLILILILLLLQAKTFPKVSAAERSCWQLPTHFQTASESGPSLIRYRPNIYSVPHQHQNLYNRWGSALQSNHLFLCYSRGSQHFWLVTPESEEIALRRLLTGCMSCWASVTEERFVCIIWIIFTCR